MRQVLRSFQILDHEPARTMPCWLVSLNNRLSTDRGDQIFRTPLGVKVMIENVSVYFVRNLERSPSNIDSPTSMGRVSNIRSLLESNRNLVCFIISFDATECTGIGAREVAQLHKELLIDLKNQLAALYVFGLNVCAFLSQGYVAAMECNQPERRCRHSYRMVSWSYHRRCC
jgi:hypothetical protein